MSRTDSGIGVPGSAARAPPRSSTIALRTSARAKNRAFPRTWYAIPRSASAASNASDCTLVRKSTAISAGETPPRTSVAIASVTPAASASSSG